MENNYQFASLDKEEGSGPRRKADSSLATRYFPFQLSGMRAELDRLMERLWIVAQPLRGQRLALGPGGRGSGRCRGCPCRGPRLRAGRLGLAVERQPAGPSRCQEGGDQGREGRKRSARAGMLPVGGAARWHRHGQGGEQVPQRPADGDLPTTGEGKAKRTALKIA